MSEWPSNPSPNLRVSDIDRVVLAVGVHEVIPCHLVRVRVSVRAMDTATARVRIRVRVRVRVRVSVRFKSDHVTSVLRSWTCSCTPHYGYAF